MTRRHYLPAGFSLIEVTLALGILGFCLLALLGLLPRGIQTNQNAVSQTAAASILSSVIADLRAIPLSNSTSQQYEITLGTAKVVHVDQQGRVGTLLNPNAVPRYRISVTFPANPLGAFAPTFVSLKITWPASVDPITTSPAGELETFAAINRY